MAFVEEVQPVARAHAGDLVGRFVIPGKDVHLFGARGQDFAAAVDALAPGHLIARGDVKIGLHAEQPFERLPIIMDVGENQESQ